MRADFILLLVHLKNLYAEGASSKTITKKGLLSTNHPCTPENIQVILLKNWQLWLKFSIFWLLTI